MHDVVIAGGTVVTPWSATSADVGIDGECIAALGPHLSGRKTIDASGMLVFPGAIDAHTHMALPVRGERSSDDFLSGTRAAACGGVTTIVDFTVGAPGRSMTDDIHRRWVDAESAIIDYALHGEVVGWHPGREAELRAAISLGVTSFKFYTAYEASGRRTPPDIMAAAFRELAAQDAVALVHAEDEGLIRSIAKRLTDGERAQMHTLATARPDLAEQTAISQVAHIARETGCRIHIVHVSSALGLDAVRAAKAEGTRLTAETAPQYLLLTSDVYDRPDGRFFAASPPLRRDADREALWGALRRQDLDFVATDHCPFTRAQKRWNGSFDDLPYGLPGVETLLPLLYSEGVAHGALSLTDLPRLLCEAPAKRYGLFPAKGALAVGSDADLVVFDPKASWTLEAATLHMNTDFSPYEGRRVHGAVHMTLSRGEIVAENGCPVGPPGRGRYLVRHLEPRKDDRPTA